MAPVSRYQEGPDVDPATGLRFPAPVAGVAAHTVRGGDRLDQLGALYYREPRLWWRIADANPDELWPFDLVGRGPEATVRIELGAPERWPGAVGALLATAGIVAAWLAGPAADDAGRPATALVRFNRFTLTAAQVVAVAAADPARLAPLRSVVLDGTVRTLALPPNLAG